MARPPEQPSLSELRRRHLTEGAPLPPGLLEALEDDRRAGARALAVAIKRRQAENRPKFGFSLSSLRGNASAPSTSFSITVSQPPGK